MEQALLLQHHERNGPRSSQFHHSDRVAPSTNDQPSHEMSMLISPFVLNSELVLRDVSNGSDPTSRRSRFRSSSVVTNPYDDISGEDLNFARKSQNPSDTVRSSGRFNKYSPTPSIKRGKAAELLKQHGSPPGIRVTAGGRIVPNMTSPPILGPRFDQNNPWKNENPNYNHFGRPGGYSQHMPANPFKGLNGYVVDMGNGNLCQIVDGELRPVQPQPDGMLGLYMPAPNLPVQNPVVQFPYQFGPPLGYQAFASATPGFPLANGSAPSSDNATSPTSNVPTPRQLRVMEQVHAKLEQELKELDRNEVLQRGNIDAHKKSEIVKHRIALTNRIDESRRGILETRRLMAEGATGAKSASTNGAGPQTQTFSNTAMPMFVGSPPLAASFGSGMAYEGIPAGFPQPMPSYTTMPSYENLPAQFQPYRPHESVNNSSALEERHANVDNGSAVGDTHGSTDTSKGYNRSMNLDGSAHQPRRSHAIEIKKPTESSKHGLNPTSPSYQPDGEDNGDQFMPSPTMIAGVDNLVQSPRSDAHGLDGAHHPSDSSATTGDFFPHDTQQYSSRKFAERSSADSAVNLQPWMTKDSSSYQHVPSSASIPTKYVFSDSPEFEHEELNVHGSFSNVQPPALTPRHHSHGHEPSDLDFISGSNFQPISPATKKQQSAHLRESIGTNEHTGALDSMQSPTAQLLNKVVEQTSSMHIHSGQGMTRPHSPTRRSEAYWEGFKTGLQQEVLGVNTDEEYRRGYRDGMRQSMVAESSPGSRSLVQQFPTPPGMYTSAMRDDTGTRMPSLSRDAHSSVPHNSVSTTPQRSDKSPSASQTLDSPQAQADFMSQPNVNISASGSARRRLKLDTSVSSRNAEPPTSPLANRSGAAAQKTVHFSKIKQVRTGSYDNDHYKKKAKTVVDRSDTPARPQFMPKAAENSSGESQAGTMCIPLSPRQSPIKTMMELLNVRSSTGSPEKKSFSRHFSSKKP